MQADPQTTTTALAGQAGAMAAHLPVAATPAHWLSGRAADLPVQFFAPTALDRRLGQFLDGFPGLVTYAVKSNPSEAVLAQMIAGGLHGFDVASPEEIRLIRRIAPAIALHYNNPVRSPAEIAFGIGAGVESWSVDTEGELVKLIAAGLPAGTEVAVRFRLPVAGAAYDFGSKFGAEPEDAVALLRRVAAAGLKPSLCFHVGTQCEDPLAWDSYIRQAASITEAAGVKIDRLNVGGGFPAARGGDDPDLPRFFAVILAAVRAFYHPPQLISEPGRGLVADAFAYAVPVKSLRPGRVYLADGIYGGLSEFPHIALPRWQVIGSDGRLRRGPPDPRLVFGPTCDSLDRLPQPVPFPADMEEGDHILFPGTGAYLNGVTTDFNGYGARAEVTVTSLAVSA